MAENKFPYDVAKDVCAEIKTVCKSFPKRVAGSKSEEDAAQYMADALSNCADEVHTERFSFAPDAFYGWTAIGITLAILSYVAYFFTAMLSLLLILLALVPYLAEYVMYKRMLDPLYKQANSQNVTAIRKSSGETRCRIYFVAHIDACKEYTTIYKFGSTVFMIQRALNVLGILYIIAISIARWAIIGEFGAGIASGTTLYVGCAGAIFLLPFFASYFLVSNKHVSDGANDDLSGCMVAIQALKTLAEDGVVFENAEVGVILTGASAPGLRGAKHWCDVHGKDFADATFIDLSTLREKEFLSVSTRELAFGPSSSDEVVQLVMRNARKEGIACSSRRAPFGATDSAAFSQVGLKSAGISAINKHLPDYYHTRYDSYENLSEECIAECYKLVMSIIYDFAGESSVTAERSEVDESQTSDVAKE